MSVAIKWCHSPGIPSYSFRVPSETIHSCMKTVWTVNYCVFYFLFVSFCVDSFLNLPPVGGIGKARVSVLSLVFACSPLVWPEQQVRHHQTGGARTPTASAPPLLLCSLCHPLQQGPQAVWGQWNGAWIASLPAPFCTIHPIPVLCVHSLDLLHQPSSSATATSCLLPILLLPSCPCPAPAIGVQHTNQSVLHWERLWGGHGAEAGPVGESGWSSATAVEWVSGAPLSQKTSRSFYF